MANFAQNKQPMGCDAQLVELGKIVTEDVWKGEYSCKKFNYVCMYVCMYVYSFKTVDKSQHSISL